MLAFSSAFRQSADRWRNGWSIRMSVAFVKLRHRSVAWRNANENASMESGLKQLRWQFFGNVPYAVIAYAWREPRKFFPVKVNKKLIDVNYIMQYSMNTTGCAKFGHYEVFTMIELQKKFFASVRTRTWVFRVLIGCCNCLLFSFLNVTIALLMQQFHCSGIWIYSVKCEF